MDSSSSSDEGESLGAIRKRKLQEHSSSRKTRKVKVDGAGVVAVPVVAEPGGGVKKKKKKARASSSGSAKKLGGGTKKSVRIKKEKEKKQLKMLNETQHLDQAVRAYRWWDAAPLKKQRDGGGTFFTPNWLTMEHRGVVFPPPADRLPSSVKLYYDGTPLTLDAEQEEVAVHYAKALGAQQLEQPATAKIFNTNFFGEFKKLFPKGHLVNQKGTKFAKFDFTKIREHLDYLRDLKKEMTKEEKNVLKEQRALVTREYGYCIVDGRIEKVGNITVEPPSLFRGRGTHPKMGKLKARIQPEEVTINVARCSAVPRCPIPGRSWKRVVHRPDVTWLAMWRLELTNAVKYVYLNNASSFKGRSDRGKYEKARKLKKYIGKIRADYTKGMKSKDKSTKQLATAMWIIDVLALRVGGEKDSDEEADTVGCCSLRVEHFNFLDKEEPLTLELDFLGKDSMRFYQKIDFSKYQENNLGQLVYGNLKAFCKKKGKTQDVFDTLTPSILNKHLSSIMPGLTAKVFRTYNASITLQSQLPTHIDPGLTSQQQVKLYNTANREVSILCNHQRSIPKSFQESFAKLEAKAKLLARQVKELKAMGRLVRAGKREEVKLKPPITPEMTTKDKAAIRHMFARAPDLEQVIKRTQRFIKLQEAHATIMQNKDENKAVSLTTAKINYMDPRITVAWCKRNEVAIERMFAATLRDKFNWAMSVPESFIF